MSMKNCLKHLSNNLLNKSQTNFLSSDNHLNNHLTTPCYKNIAINIFNIAKLEIMIITHNIAFLTASAHLLALPVKTHEA
jgi:hypothetical protein